MAMVARGLDGRVEKPPESDGWQAKAPAPQRAGAQTLWGRRFRLPILEFSWNFAGWWPIPTDGKG
jgi:hypothetical protein